MTRISFVLSLLLICQTAGAEPWRRHTIDDSSRGADGVRLADVNADGLLDIATGWEEGGLIRVYLNPGTGKSRSRWPAVIVGQVKSPEDAVFADLDGDGRADVVSCCEGRTKSVYVHWAPATIGKAASTAPDDYLNATAWRTEAIPCVKNKQAWMFALPMDVDGRGGIDLVIGSKGAGASIGWLESPANPRDLSAWKYHELVKAGWIMSLQAHDMDRDGDLDVVASDRKGAGRGVMWLENPGAQSNNAWEVHRVGGSDREIMFLTLADVAHSGRHDVVAAVRGRGFAWFQSVATTPRWKLAEIPLPAGCGTGKGVAVGDIDRDGHNDLVFSCENAKGALSGVRWMSNSRTEPPAWKDHEISGPQGVKFDRLELLDLDGDGDLDVLTCEERDNLGVIWYENPSSEKTSISCQ